MGTEGHKSRSRKKIKINPKRKPVNNYVNSTKLQKMNILYTNADQLKNKLNELNARIKDNIPNIIGITEVKNKNKQSEIVLAEYTLDVSSNFCLFQKNLDTDKGRGLIMYIDQSLNAVEVKMQTNFEENLFVKIALSKADKLLVGLIYTSPSITDQ